MTSTESKKRKKFRILSLDGGPSGLTYTQMIRELLIDLGEEGADFFRRADLIAGNSFGGILSTHLAVQLQDNPSDEHHIVDNWYKFAETAYNILMPDNPKILARTIAGDEASFETEKFKEYLQSVYGDIKMQELKQRLALLSYRFAAPSIPKTFHNFGHPDTIDEPDLKAFTAVMRSAACPVSMPMYDGFVDGCVISNNPAMAALSEVISAGRTSSDPDLQGLTLDDIVILSLGGDEHQQGNYLGKVQSAGEDSWGWKNWLGANLKRWKEERPKWGERGKVAKDMLEENTEIITMASLFLCGNAQAIADQVRLLLPPGQMFRMAPQPKKGIGRQMALQYLGKHESLLKDAAELTEDWTLNPNEVEFKPTYNQSKAWIQKHWLSDD